ncbi:Na(+)/citrate cotransporter [Patella vulgata]|uniref:Na(+)/citrate cotransporter n=1 Tax=Patella vulgata TaxID=6465 RepID=UPI0024A8BEDA|nr:Na(+)/citrate cotransporter [Patella vulgata]
MGALDCLRSIRECSTLWFSVLVPLVVLPLPVLHPNDVSRCAYCVIVIALFWMTEIIPLAVTSLLPVILFPLWGLMSVKDVCSSYVKDTLMLFLGSLIVAVAVERWNLHKRLALRTLTLVGPEPKWLMLGIMFPCWFLSMWMSNTATTAMMMPIVIAILHQIKECRQKIRNQSGIMLSELGNGQTTHNENIDDSDEANTSSVSEEEDKEFTILAKSFSICAAYAANCGGMATLTGTPPNIIFKGIADGLYEKYNTENDVNFANWMLFALPISTIIFIFCWGWLTFFMKGKYCCPCVKSKEDMTFDPVKQIIMKEYSAMGTITFPEIVVACNFVILVLLWVTRSPGFVPGWGALFKPGYAKDSTSAILICIMMFILPAKPPRCFKRKSSAYDIENSTESENYVYEPLLNWKIVHEKLAWGVLLLMGGGFALADGCQKSGFSDWISDNLIGLAALPPWVIAMLLSIIIAGATEITSNAATSNLFLPIVGRLAIDLGINPLYFMIPCTVATSLAFLLPVATPPNAIAFSSGYLQVKDMVKTGIFMNIFSLVVVNIALNLWGVPIYNLHHLPKEFFSNYSATPTVVNVTLLN